jgi:putative colanic acid biosynthesis acetyltransferase WcaF
MRQSYCPSPFSFRNKVARTIWNVTWLVLFRPSPRPLHAWRRGLLRLFGARIGRGVCLSPSCRIAMPWKLQMRDHSTLGDYVICYNIGGVQIGAYSTVSQYSHLCSSGHDYEHPNMRQTFAPIEIEDRAWICADAFIGPGVHIGQGAVLGARASAFSDIEPWTVAGGNPARAIRKRVIHGLQESSCPVSAQDSRPRVPDALPETQSRPVQSHI